jgi:hypothetical protein
MNTTQKRVDAETTQSTASKTQEDLYAIIESLKSVTVPLIIDACNFYNKTNVSLVKNNYKPSLPSCPKCFVEKYLEGLIDEIMDAKSLSNEVKYSMLHKIGMLVTIACDGGCVDTADAWNFMDAYVAINVKTQIAKQQNK